MGILKISQILLFIKNYLNCLGVHEKYLSYCRFLFYFRNLNFFRLKFYFWPNSNTKVFWSNWLLVFSLQFDSWISVCDPINQLIIILTDEILFMITTNIMPSNFVVLENKKIKKLSINLYDWVQFVSKSI